MLLLASSVTLFAQRAPIQIHADLTDAPRRIVRADVDLPVSAGPLDLITPEWIPGAHGPRGPVGDIAGIRFEANGRTLPWKRDPVNLYEYHLEIPSGVSTLHAHLECVSTRHVGRTWATLEWESLLLYPAHIPVREIAIQPTVTVPGEWSIATSLVPVTHNDPQHPASGTVRYAPTTVELLEDSPVMTGRFFREYVLNSGSAPDNFLDVFGPTAASVQVSTTAIDQMSHLVRESFAMYGPPHYTSYHFLVLEQKQNGHGGLEHHESSDNTVSLDFFKGYTPEVGETSILTHEFTHSWNGKFRRPDGLTTHDYATPMQNNLLWVYEGLTNYLGDVMAARIGTMNAEQYRQELAVLAAQQDAQRGRSWRSVEDTTFTDAMPRNGGRSAAWTNWKRSIDYYYEGSLFWLDVDTTLRKLTEDRKSLRDFLLVFLQKGKPGVVRVEPYTLAEVEKDLNQVAPYDWANFIKTRLYDVQPNVNTEGIEQAGYRLEYTSTPTPELAKLMANEPSMTAWFSIGLDEDNDGTINDVREGSAADKAGLAPGQKITSINGTVLSVERLTEVLQSGAPVQLTVQEDEAVIPVTIGYTEGLRYPRLTRVDGTPDRLKEILTPITPAMPQ